MYSPRPKPWRLHNLRTALYPRLAPIANRWNRQMGIAV
ncbi:2OG-Fe(II) oxygenase, partial [Achromobacter xylosoxidans]